MRKPREAEHDQVRAIPMRKIQEQITEYLEDNDDTGVADAVDLMISQGAYHVASDIHLEPWSDCVSLRYRVDGILQQIAVIPLEFQPKIVARIKVLADLIVYRKDVPQDGRIDLEKVSCGRPMRVSTVPTVKGEKVVLRLLGESPELYHLDTLGFQAHVVKDLHEIITRTQGTLLLTGPS